MNLAVIVASVRRREEIGQLLHHLQIQTKQPSSIILSAEQASDVPENLAPEISVVMGSRGLTLQRNRGMEKALKNSEIIIFFDDDFIPADNALENIERLFQDNPDIVGATGRVLRDGVKLGGISYDAAIATLEAFRKTNDHAPDVILDSSDLYGCNMAFRAAAIADSRFDENLPLYAWQEDVDFAGQLLKKGRVVRTTAFAGVHRGVNKGRSPGLALGYSQVINPCYLVAKGTMRPGKAARLVIKNLLANHIKLLRPEPFIDRAGRMRGNWLGLRDLVKGKLEPNMILRLSK